MKTAFILLSTVLLATLSNASVFSDLYDFDRGLLSGFANQDLSESDQCLEVFDKIKTEVGEVWDDFDQMKNETLKTQAIRDILQVIEKLPEEFKGCREVSGLVESLAKKVILLIDIDDFVIRASKNMLYNALDIMAKVT